MEFKPRRPYGVAEYLESDRDFVLNNIELCVELLERIEASGKTNVCLTDHLSTWEDGTDECPECGEPLNFD